MIPYARHHITQQDIDAVVDVLVSDFLTQGPAIPEFEYLVSNYVGSEHAIAVNSATSALHMACLALGLGPGDLLWTVPNTFVASANCGRLCGADVDFVDIDPQNYCMDVSLLADKLKNAKQMGRLPKVIVPVHYSGLSAEMKEIGALANQYGVRVIEDAAHAIGGQYDGERIGNCAHSDIVVFSFHAIKNLTTGEGGVAVTNDSFLANRMARIRTHGITRNREFMECINCEPWWYEQLDLGLNYRMTDFQAALGSSQMTRLDEFIARRKEIAAMYQRKLIDLALILPAIDRGDESAWHLYSVLVDDTRTTYTRNEVFHTLVAEGIRVNVHYIPVHFQPYYKRLGFNYGDFPVSEWFYEREISLPLFFGLTDADQLKVIESLERVL